MSRPCWPSTKSLPEPPSSRSMPLPPSSVSLLAPPSFVERWPAARLPTADHGSSPPSPETTRLSVLPAASSGAVAAASTRGTEAVGDDGDLVGRGGAVVERRVDVRSAVAQIVADGRGCRTASSAGSAPPRPLMTMPSPTSLPRTRTSAAGRPPAGCPRSPPCGSRRAVGGVDGHRVGLRVVASAERGEVDVEGPQVGARRSLTTWCRCRRTRSDVVRSRSSRSMTMVAMLRVKRTRSPLAEVSKISPMLEPLKSIVSVSARPRRCRCRRRDPTGTCRCRRPAGPVSCPAGRRRSRCRRRRRGVSLPLLPSSVSLSSPPSIVMVVRAARLPTALILSLPPSPVTIRLSVLASRLRACRRRSMARLGAVGHDRRSRRRRRAVVGTVSASRPPST